MEIERFKQHLISEEKSENTVLKYIRDVMGFVAFTGGEITKETVIAYKNDLQEQGYAKRSINSMLCSVNAWSWYFSGGFSIISRAAKEVYTRPKRFSRPDIDL